MDENLAQTLQNQLDRWQLFAPCLGTNVTVIDSTHGTWNATSGYADPDTKAPLQAGGGFYIYSITKTFTAVRILQLVEMGSIDLDAPITAYLSDVSLPAGVTVRRLLNHTSGVPSYTDLPAYLPATQASPGRPWTYEYTRDITCQGALDFAPGAGWHYSNTGYMLLVRMMQQVTQQSLAQNLAQGIFEPLKLQDTYVAQDIDQGRLIPGYCRYMNDAELMENAIPHYHPGWCETGLIASTTTDTAEFFAQLFSGALVNENSLAAMRTGVSCAGTAGRSPSMQNPGYGLGLMLDQDWGYGGFFGHSGDGPGYTPLALVVPDVNGRRVALAIFTNTSMGGAPFYLAKDLLRVLQQ